MNFNLTDKQARKIVKVITNGNFFLSGVGHFNVNREEFAEIIKLSFGNKPFENVENYYNKLCRRNGM